MINSIEKYIFLFFIYSFLGWSLESFGSIINPKVKKFVNRGFMIGPYCPVYGIGVVFTTILLSKYSNDVIVLFFLSILICGILEYFTGYAMEKLFNARWWDYSKNKFNINGRICLETLVPFGIAAVIIICKINPFLINKYELFPNIIRHIFTILFSVSFVIDFVVSFKIILSFKGEIRNRDDNTEEISEMVKDKADELSERVLDKAEDILMKTESDIRYYGRKYKLKFLRKSKYTRKRLEETMPDTLEELSERINERKEKIEKRIKKEKQRLNNQLRLKKAEYELKQKERIEVTKQIVEKFKNKSTLRGRLMNAFPDLEISEKNKKKK